VRARAGRLSARALGDLALLALLAAAAVAVAGSLQPARPYVVLLAACLVPGGAILTALGRDHDLLSNIALVVGLSVAVELLGSAALAWAGWWHPDVLAYVLGGISALLLVVDLAREPGR
jgi:uncharacterized membrane protein